jgi:hypothetical protein
MASKENGTEVAQTFYPCRFAGTEGATMGHRRAPSPEELGSTSRFAGLRGAIGPPRGAVGRLPWGRPVVPFAPVPDQRAWPASSSLFRLRQGSLEGTARDHPVRRP